MIDVKGKAMAVMGRKRVRKSVRPAVRLSATSFRHAHWTLDQMVTHHTVNGCILRVAEFSRSGTESGPTSQVAGPLLELSVGGEQPIKLPNGEMRTFLEDHDAVILRGWCEKPGAAREGFGECLGHVPRTRSL